MNLTVREEPLFLLVEFHAPPSSNALSLEAARELANVVRAHRRWSLPVVVRSAHPRMFCSGGNLADYAKLRGKAPGLRINREITRHLDGFARWAPLKLALIEGDVLGGGMEWLARFDFRWGTPQAVFSFWQRRIGLSTGWGGGGAWAEKIGEDVVRKLLLEAKILSARRALSLGLIDRIVTPWRALDEVKAWCADMSGAQTDWSSKKENEIFQGLWHGPEHKAALARWRK